MHIYVAVCAHIYSCVCMTALPKFYIKPVRPRMALPFPCLKSAGSLLYCSYFHQNYNLRLWQGDLDQTTYSMRSLLSIPDKNYNMRKLGGKVTIRLLKPAQPVLYSRQYFCNACRIDSNCIQHFASASNNLKVLVYQSRSAICRFEIGTENRQLTIIIK